MSLELTGRRALVCGASRGIGKATAEALSGAGARVIVAARDGHRLDQVVAGLPRPAGQEHESLQVDFDDSPGVESRLAGLARSGAVHIVVNNSGGPPAGTASQAEVTAFESAFRQHLVANQTILRALLPEMKASGYGRIVNIISTSVKEPIPGLGVSNTIRGAVASWAKTLSRELGPFGITVNNVLPGFTATERLEYFFEKRAEASGDSVDTVRQQARMRVPAGRFAEPQEIAAAIVFLASPAAAYVNGINLPVDGGLIASL
ncbi:MAG: SDR family oxidoreductase [Chromatiales bacterium]|nr:SDR family oxidoreductase [Chromatiales bacterium]